MYELFDTIERRQVFAMCVQETWREGNGKDILEKNGMVALLAVYEKKKEDKGRRARGVGIILGSTAKEGLDRATLQGRAIHNDLGDRVIAVRLVMDNELGEETGLFIMSAYAPQSDAADEVKDSFYASLEQGLARKGKGDMLMLGIDANASMGTGVHRSDACGKYGNSRVSEAGRNLRGFLEQRELVSLASFFRKGKVRNGKGKRRKYNTWTDFNGKYSYQIDHMITEAANKKFVTDCGAKGQIVDSDHKAVCCVVRLKTPFKKRLQLSGRDSVCKRDFSGLDVEELRDEFNEIVRVKVSKGSSLEEAIAEAQTSLPKRKRKGKGWFADAEEVLRPLVDARNQAYDTFWHSRSVEAKKRLVGCRQALKAAIATAKNDWVLVRCGVVNEGSELHGGLAGVDAWKAVVELRDGLGKPRSVSLVKLKKKDGTMCATPEEAAEARKGHFEALFGREPAFDSSVMDLVERCELANLIEQQPEKVDSAATPEEEEIWKAVDALKCTGPGLSGVHAAAVKAIMHNEELRKLLVDMVVGVWETQKVPVEWESCLLKILDKPGDQSDPSNCRGIMLLEVVYKVVGNLLKFRIMPISEKLDHEQQCGFRPLRGCMDAVFNLKSAIRKRKEHGMETWVLLLDLVKAFDRVPRELLWLVMERFGFPKLIIRLLKSLHERVLVNFEVEGVKKVIHSIIGVKQGDLLGPILFNIYGCAVMVAWRTIRDGMHKRGELKSCLFKTNQDFVLGTATAYNRRAWKREGEEFSMDDSTYADDTAALFASREDCEVGVPKLIELMARFGGEVHVRKPGQVKASKSVVVFIAKKAGAYTKGVFTFGGTGLSDIDTGKG